MKRLAACVVVCLGCDAQVDPSYAGDAVATLHGSGAGFVLDDLADTAGILWNANLGPDVPDGPIAAAVVRASFPATLTVLILARPPADAFFGVDGEEARIAEGYLHLLAAGAGAPPTVDDFVGVAVDDALVYVEGTVAPGSLTAAYLGGTPAPGYHLLRWRATTDLGPAQRYFADRCAAASGGDCAARRRYQLSPSPADLDTDLVFVSRSGR